MFDYVIGVLSATPAIGRIALLAPDAPALWPHAWIEDRARGLNIELEAFQAAEGLVDLLIIHADLPLLSCADIDALLQAATHTGVAIAPDRHGRGTNALALRAGAALRPRFGPDSLAQHLRDAPKAAVVRRQGLALDVDTPEDLAMAQASGFDMNAMGETLSWA